MSARAVWTGGCLCGAVRYRARGKPFEITHCHCDTCRRAAGAAFVTWLSFRSPDFTFTKGRPGRFQSSPRGIRSHCRRCGTPLTFVNPQEPDEVDVTVFSLDAPDRARPSSHSWYRRRARGIRLADRLPKHPGDLPPEKSSNRWKKRRKKFQ